MLEKIINFLPKWLTITIAVVMCVMSYTAIGKLSYNYIHTTAVCEVNVTSERFRCDDGGGGDNIAAVVWPIFLPITIAMRNPYYVLFVPAGILLLASADYGKNKFDDYMIEKNFQKIRELENKLKEAERLNEETDEVLKREAPELAKVLRI